MNKIFSIVRNSHGQLVVANEYAKSAHGSPKMKTGLTKLTGVLMGTFLTMGIATAQVTSSQGGLAGGVASGDSSIAIGESSWTTSEHGSSAGAGSIATGGDMTREQFEELLKSIEDDRKAREEKLKERAQVAVKINSNIKQIKDLNTTIKGYDELIKQNQQNQAVIQNLQNQINTKNNAKDTLTESQAFKDAMTNYENYKAGALGRNINEYANFSMLINGLNWQATPPSGKTLYDVLGEELATRIKTASVNIYNKYKQEDENAGKGEMDRYVDYIKKYAGEYGSRQGVYDGLIKKYSANNEFSFQEYSYLYLPSIGNNRYDKKMYIDNKTIYRDASMEHDVVAVPYSSSYNNKSETLKYYLPGITNETINNIIDSDGRLDFSKSNLYTISANNNNNMEKDRIILFNTFLTNQKYSIFSNGKCIQCSGNKNKITNNIISKSFDDGGDYTSLVPSRFIKIEAKNYQNNDDVVKVVNAHHDNFRKNGLYSALRFYDDIATYSNNGTIGAIYGGLNGIYVTQTSSGYITYAYSNSNFSPVYIKSGAFVSIPTSVQKALFANDLVSTVDFIEERDYINNQLIKERKILNDITPENLYTVAPEIRAQKEINPEHYNVLFSAYKEAEAKKIAFLKELVKEGGIYQLAADLQERTKNNIDSVSEEEKREIAQKIAAEQERLKIEYDLNSPNDISTSLSNKFDQLSDYLKDVYFKKRTIKTNIDGTNIEFYEIALSQAGIDKYNANFQAWQDESFELRNDLFTKLVAFDNEDRLIKDVTKEAQDIINAYNSKQSELNNLNNQIDDLNKQLEALDGGGDIATANSERQKAIDEKNKLEAQKEALDNQLNGLGEELAKLDQQIAEKFNLQKGQSSLAQGNGSFASGDHSVAIGTESSAMNNSAIAIGNTATASGEGAIALGKESVASSKNSVAIGVSNAVTGEGSVTVGSSNVVNGANSVAMGQSNQITGEKSVAVGFGHVIKGNNSGAFGDPNIIEANNAYALGNNNKVYADNVLTFGNDNTIGTQPTEGDGVAAENRAGYASTAIGNNVNVQGKNSVVIGNQTSSANDYNIVLGYGSSDAYTPPVTTTTTTSTDSTPSTGDNSAPTGSGSIVSVGNASDGLFRKIVNVAEGAISSTSKEAINGSQLNELNTKITNLINLKADIDKAIEDLKNNVQNLNITDPAITVTQRSGEATPDKTDDVYQGSVLGALSDEQKAAGVNSLVLTDLANGNVSADSKDAITGAQLNNTANDIAKHLGGGSANNGGRITAPSYTVTDVDGKTDKTYNNVGDAVNALNNLAKSGTNTEKAFESVAQNLGGGATYDKENKVVTKPTYKVTNIVNDKVEDHNNVGSAIEALDNNDKALATAVTYNAQNIAQIGQNVAGLNQAVGQMASQVDYNTNEIANLKQNYGSLRADLNKYKKRADAGVAAAMAVSAITIAPGQKYTMGAGVGYHAGASALAIGFKARSDNNKHIFSLSGAVNSQSDVSASVGYSFGW